MLSQTQLVGAGFALQLRAGSRQSIECGGAPECSSRRRHDLGMIGLSGRRERTADRCEVYLSAGCRGSERGVSCENHEKDAEVTAEPRSTW